MNQKKIIVLGSPNDNVGNLLLVAKSRLDKAIELYNQYGYTIVCTGGYGSHFNTTDTPHAQYAKNYLISQGIYGEDIYASILSSNTVEDALETHSYLKHCDSHVSGLIVVSSDFHIPRVKFIFGKIFNNEYSLEFVGSSNDILNPDDLKKYILHEKKALDGLKKKGLLVDGKVVS